MQRHQRQFHRLLWVMIAAVTAAALYVAISRRPEIPFQNPPVEQP